jgi:Rrf2 family protein
MMGQNQVESHHGRPVGSGVVWPSAKTVYALRACAALAGAYPKGLLKTAEISRVSGAPIRFLSKILAELRDADLVLGKRGYYGGYMLARDPNDISVTELMLAVGAPELLVPLPPQLEQPRSAFVDDLRSRLSQVALDAFGAATVAEVAAGYQFQDAIDLELDTDRLDPDSLDSNTDEQAGVAVPRQPA